MPHVHPYVKVKTKTYVRVTDAIGNFEFDANDINDVSVLEGVTNLITAFNTHPDRDQLEHCVRFAVYELLAGYFALDRAKDGRADRLTNALFTGSIEL